MNECLRTSRLHWLLTGISCVLLIGNLGADSPATPTPSSFAEFPTPGPTAASISENGQPSVDAILSHVLTNSTREEENDRRFHVGYGFVRTKLQVERNGKGKVTKNRDLRWEHIPENPEPVTAVPLRSGPNNPLLPGESGDDGDVNVGDDGEIKGRAFDKKDFVLNADLLSRFDFELVGTEWYQGRPAWLLKFKPRSGRLPVRNMKEKFINKAAGRVWVDVEEGFVVKVDLFLTESVSVVGGLVGAVRSCQYGFERERTEEGLWFTRSVNWNLEGRQVFNRKTIDYNEERLDVRRLF